MSSERNINVIPVAKFGFVDGGNYEAHRPGYTDEAVKEVISMATDSIKSLGDCQYDILELGAGTGKFTQCLLKNIPQELKVLLTEPSENFLKTLEKKFPDMNTRQCSADNIPVTDHSVNAIIAAQCFHWFAKPEAITEITRVLKPGGNFVLIWNIKDQSSLLNSDFRNLILKWVKDTPQYFDGAWKDFLDRCNQVRLVSRKQLGGVQLGGSIEEVVHLASTLSFIQSLEETEKKRALTEINKFYENHPESREKEYISMPMKTDVLHYKV
ncbi:uncharacterized protein LOC125653347 [Ostrea edulis]|uniref:uncharacterized protein LOC125653347 n=1 Tax=Ostrea edulis TaxID=37623 RepID=UPI00209528FE|nr:uncharacterized protein LOC125653347 [Ostrea edulis]